MPSTAERWKHPNCLRGNFDDVYFSDDFLNSYIHTMTEEEYKLLKCFPKDKTYLSHLELQNCLDPNGQDYNNLEKKCNILFNAGFVEGQIPEPGLRITDKGLKALDDYEKPKVKKITNGQWQIIIAIVGIVLTIIVTVGQCK